MTYEIRKSPTCFGKWFTARLDEIALEWAKGYADAKEWNSYIVINHTTSEVRRVTA